MKDDTRARLVAERDAAQAELAKLSAEIRRNPRLGERWEKQMVDAAVRNDTAARELGRMDYRDTIIREERAKLSAQGNKNKGKWHQPALAYYDEHIATSLRKAIISDIAETHGLADSTVANFLAKNRPAKS